MPNLATCMAASLGFDLTQGVLQLPALQSQLPIQRYCCRIVGQSSRVEATIDLVLLHCASLLSIVTCCSGQLLALSCKDLQLLSHHQFNNQNFQRLLELFQVIIDYVIVQTIFGCPGPDIMLL